MAGGGWGLIGNATAKVPGDLLAQILADAAAADEAKFKRAGEVQKRVIDLRDANVREGGLEVQRGNLGVSQGNLTLEGQKRQDALSKSEQEERLFNDLVANAPQWAKLPLLAHRRAGVSLTPKDATVSPEQQFKHTQDAELAKIAATTAAQAGRDQQQHNFRIDEQSHAASLRPEPAEPKKPTVPSNVRMKLAETSTIEKMIDDALTFGDQHNWKGVGGFYQGALKGFIDRNLGTKDATGEKVRNKIGNLQGTIAKARGGASFTQSEQEMLDRYTPTVNDSPAVIKAKLTGLREWIGMTKQGIAEQYDTGAAPTPAAKMTVAELLKKYGGG